MINESEKNDENKRNFRNKILKAKSVKLLLSTEEQPIVESSALMLKEWKQVIKEGK